MKSLVKLILFICLTIILLSSCNVIRKQDNYLLPSSNSIEIISKKEIGITTYTSFKVNGKINTNELYLFPKNEISKTEKAVIRWHKPTNKEIKDFKSFVKEEQSANEIAVKIARELQRGGILFAQIYDKDKSPMGKNGYSVTDWIDLYVLDLPNKKLIHIDYGKF